MSQNDKVAVHFINQLSTPSLDATRLAFNQLKITVEIQADPIHAF